MSTLGLTDAYLESKALAACFAAPAVLRHMLAFEAALATAAAAAGLIPAPAGALIVACAEEGGFDIEQIAAATRDTASPAVPLVRLLTARVAARSAAAADHVHFGSTSQDVMDTALMLCCRASAGLLEARLASVAAPLADLARTHRRTAMVARTLGQQAGPTTFGVKAAAWLDGVTQARGRLRRAARELPLQFGGATGTRAAYGADGAKLANAIAARLALRAAPPWHTERGAVRAFAAAVAEAGASCGKIAGDILRLAQTEVGELAEAAVAGRGTSSALPHKQNPVNAIAAAAAARRVPDLLATVFAAFDHEHERAAGAWHVESRAVAELAIATGGALEALARALDGLRVERAAMAHNLEFTRGLVYAEAAVYALTPVLGRRAAAARVTAACDAVRGSARTLLEVLRADAAVQAACAPERLAEALAAAAHPPGVDTCIDDALARHAACAAAMPPSSAEDAHD